jgi:hypothetical protein
MKQTILGNEHELAPSRDGKSMIADLHLPDLAECEIDGVCYYNFEQAQKIENMLRKEGADFRLPSV